MWRPGRRHNLAKVAEGAEKAKDSGDDH